MRQQKMYDHRLRDLVRKAGDVRIATRLGVPPSTAAGWLQRTESTVVSLDVSSASKLELEAEVVPLKKLRRAEILGSGEASD